MKRQYLLVALTAGIFAITMTTSPVVLTQSLQLAQNRTEPLTLTTAQQVAAKITVRIKVGQGGGSGVIVAKKNNTYLVLTNAHVVRGTGATTIQTTDGQQHMAKRVNDIQVGDFDLALMEFKSTRSYQLAGLQNFQNKDAALNEGREVFAAGFPYDGDKLRLVEGAVTQLPAEAFVNGTQIGYVTKGDIKQGMSGGPILDSFGDLIGINSTLTQPIMSPYRYVDGTKPPQDKVLEYRQANWGVPIYNFLTRLNPNILHSYQQLPKLHRAVTPTGYMAKLDRLARLVTVRIENAEGNGSGVIVSRSGNSYDVLTAEHVVKNTQRLKVITHEQRVYQISPSEIKRSVGTDLAVIKFTSSQIYPVATLGNYPIVDGSVVFPGGWPDPRNINSQQWQWALNPGLARSKERGEFNTQDRQSFSNGYDLSYTSMTYGGMSGGPLFDGAGRVIGVHGKAEGEKSTGTVLGNSLGISIRTFLGLADQLSVKAETLQVKKTMPGSLDNAQRTSVNLIRNNIPIPNKSGGAQQWIEYGNQLYRLGQYPKAVTAFNQAIKLESDSLTAYYGKGLALLTNGDDSSALTAFERAITLVPAGSESKFYYLWSYHSMALRDLKKYPAALVAITKAISLEPRDSILLNEKAGLLIAAQRYSEAIKIYDQTIEKDKKSWAYYNRGLAKFNSGDQKGAIADYDMAIQINPQDAEAYANRGASKWDLGDIKGAMADFDMAIQINPQLATAYSNRGLAKSGSGDKKGAIADYDMAIRLNPQGAAAYANRGLVKSNSGDQQGAIADCDIAIRLNPQYTEAYLNRGLAKSKSGDQKGAIADCDIAIRLNPQYTEAYLNRGLAKSKSGDQKGAIADYSRAVLIKPQYAQAYLNRGSVKSKLGDQKGAIADFDMSIRINPQFATAYYGRGDARSRLGDKKGAIADYDLAIRADSQYTQAYIKRGLMKSGSGDKNGATIDLNIAAKLLKAQGNKDLYDKVIAAIQEISK